jgi:ABC-type antimicrobial peptide transport system ATPase subunit
MKARFPTISTIVGGVKYDVHLRVLPGRAPSHAGPESPDYLRPGSPPRISIIRILHAGVVVSDQVTNDLHWSVRQQIESAVLSLAAGGGASPGAVDVSQSVSATPSFSDPEDFR